MFCFSERWNDRCKRSHHGSLVWGKNNGDIIGRWKWPVFHSVSCCFWWVRHNITLFLDQPFHSKQPLNSQSILQSKVQSNWPRLKTDWPKKQINLQHILKAKVVFLVFPQVVMNFNFSVQWWIILISKKGVLIICCWKAVHATLSLVLIRRKEGGLLLKKN